MAANTRAAYTADWDRFTRWCTAAGHAPLPADRWLVASYLTEHAAAVKPDGRPAYTPATLSRWCSSINQFHTAAGHPAPGSSEVVRRTLAGIRKTRATPPVRRAPLLLDDIKTVLFSMREHAAAASYAAKVRERRDSLLLLLGFAGALRRAELVGLDLADLILHRHDGLHLKLRMSKTDQQAAGITKAAPYGAHPETCVPCAYLRWRQVLDAADHPPEGLTPRAATIRALRGAGPFDGHVCGKATDPEKALHLDTPGDGEWGRGVAVFRTISQGGIITADRLSAQTVAYLVKARGQRAGLPAATVDLLGGHSLRAGFVTQAYRSGADAHAVMRQTGHRSVGMLEVYAREHAPLVGNAVTKLGL